MPQYDAKPHNADTPERVTRVARMARRRLRSCSMFSVVIRHATSMRAAIARAMLRAVEWFVVMVRYARQPSARPQPQRRDVMAGEEDGPHPRCSDVVQSRLKFLRVLALYPRERRGAATRLALRYSR